MNWDDDIQLADVLELEDAVAALPLLDDDQVDRVLALPAAPHFDDQRDSSLFIDVAMARQAHAERVRGLVSRASLIACMHSAIASLQRELLGVARKLAPELAGMRDGAQIEERLRCELENALARASTAALQ